MMKIPTQRESNLANVQSCPTNEKRELKSPIITPKQPISMFRSPFISPRDGLISRTVICVFCFVLQSLDDFFNQLDILCGSSHLGIMLKKPDKKKER